MLTIFRYFYNLIENQNFILSEDLYLTNKSIISMKQAIFKLAVLVCILGGSVQLSNGQNIQTQINVVTTAVPFLRISPDSRAGGMGDVGIATTPDQFSAYWNLGKLPFFPTNASIGATYTPWLNDLGLNDVYLISAYGIFHPFKNDESQVVSAGLRYFSLGSIQFTDALGNNLNNFTPREMAFDVGYARKLSNRIGLGIALRYISSRLASGSFNGQNYQTGTAVAGDIHLYQNTKKENGSGLAWGVTLSNLGSKISYTKDATQKDFIPANFGIGASYTKVCDADNKMTIAADMNKLMVPTPPTDTAASVLNDYRTKGVVGSWFSSWGDAPGGFSEEIKEMQFSLGVEYWYKNQFAFRTGYFYENPLKGNRKYFTMGAGLKYNMFGLNFSYLLPSGSGVNRNPLSNTLRFSLLFDFDKK